MKIINGKKISEELLAALARRPLKSGYLAGIVSRRDAAGESYQAMKKAAAAKAGIDYRITTLENDATTREAISCVEQFAKDDHCHGIVVQLPLPLEMDTDAILNAIPAEKDIDTLSDAARMSDIQTSGIASPAVRAVLEILAREGFTAADKHIAIVGTGRLIGKPLASWFLKNRIGKVRILGEGSDASLLADADLVILGAGKAGLVQSSMLKAGAAVIDFGTSQDAAGRVRGDFAPTPEDAKLLFYTPTPGGTGPILIAKLLENYAAAATS